MNDRIRTGDKFRVIDRESPYFGKTVIFRECYNQDMEMINLSGKTVSRSKNPRYIFKIEDTGDLIEFTAKQLKRL